MQNAEASLEVRYPLPFVVPVRTKKRYFVPPAVGIKKKAAASADQEAKARAAGVVLRQEYMERAINIACTGTDLFMCFHTSSNLQFVVHRIKVKRVATVTMKQIIYIVTITNISLLSTTTAGVFDPYITPEGDARLSSLSKESLKRRTEQIKQDAASQLA